ncbi:uncharacterized protein LOC126985268 [Eriocheir sinensis]|uniref:uncharacterized protein LOC126985268 n=1 Tax=Eriocheir sinensis TaxID=95602 RepID=UPI0021C5967B|nr:uncharacterized protein LOC126985268 [Eriocheir sinensis]
MSLRRPNSICYMSLADAFLTRLRQEAESRSKSAMGKGVALEVVAVEGDRQEFIYGYLTRVYERRQGTFSKPKVFAKQTIYECERSAQCKGNSSGDPTKTRANGCSAYVSFLFEEGATVTACVVRSRLTHNGHDPTNREESRVSRIDLSLRFMIEGRLSAGMRVSEVMGEVAKWNKTQGYSDHHNRRFFPTRQDIQQIALSLRRLQRSLHPSQAPRRKTRQYDTPGKDGATRVLRGELREWCVFHQTRTTAGPSPRPLVVVLQSDAMRDVMVRFGEEVLCIARNYEGLRQYGCAVYVLAVRDGGGGAHPGAYVITSNDEPKTFTKALRELLTHCPLMPRVVLMDQELKGFSEALATLLPETTFLIPWYQVAQQVHAWLQSQVSDDPHLRRMLLQCLQELRGCSTRDALMEGLAGLGEQGGLEGFTDMLWADWLTCPALWCDFGRAGVWETKARSVMYERFFLRLPHQLLKGLHSRRKLPDLLRLIAENVTQRKNASEGLLDMSLLLEGSAGEHARSLLKQGWGELVTWQGEWVAHVPCHTLLETSYRITLPTMECECPCLTLAGPCVHLCLVSTLAQLRQGPSLQDERQRLAEEALQQGSYLLEGGMCVVFHSEGVCVTGAGDGACVCTCVSDALGTPCIGALFLGLAGLAGEGDPTHIPDTLPSPPITSLKEEPDPSHLHQPLKPDPLTIHQPKPAPSSLQQPKTAPSAPLQQPLILIQTHTGLPVPQTPETKDADHNPSLDHPVSSKDLIKKLHDWAASKDFRDSEVLQSILRAAHDAVFGSPTHPTLTSSPPRPQASGSRKLRAVVRPVKRRKKEEEEEEEEEGYLWLPPPKVTRSGRTVRSKEEPDFVT